MKEMKYTQDVNIADHQVVMLMTDNHAWSQPEAVKADTPPPTA